jgi:hypothetical protein
VRDTNRWLPDDAWEDREQERWSPARYGICFRRETGTIDSPLDLAAMSAQSQPYVIVPSDARHWQPPNLLDTEPGPDCYDVTMVAAQGYGRSYEEAIEIGGASLGEDGYDFEAAPPVSALIHVSIVPLLPHGELAIVEAEDCNPGQLPCLPE